MTGTATILFLSIWLPYIPFEFLGKLPPLSDLLLPGGVAVALMAGAVLARRITLGVIVLGVAGIGEWVATLLGSVWGSVDISLPKAMFGHNPLAGSVRLVCVVALLIGAVVFAVRRRPRRGSPVALGVVLAAIAAIGVSLYRLVELGIGFAGSGLATGPLDWMGGYWWVVGLVVTGAQAAFDESRALRICTAVALFVYAATGLYQSTITLDEAPPLLYRTTETIILALLAAMGIGLLVISRVVGPASVPPAAPRVSAAARGLKSTVTFGLSLAMLLEAGAIAIVWTDFRQFPSTEILSPWVVPIAVVLGLTLVALIVARVAWDRLSTVERAMLAVLIVVPVLLLRPVIFLALVFSVLAAVVVVGVVVIGGIALLALVIWSTLGSWGGGAGRVVTRSGKTVGSVESSGTYRDEYGRNVGSVDHEGVVRDYYGNVTGRIEKR